MSPTLLLQLLNESHFFRLEYSGYTSPNKIILLSQTIIRLSSDPFPLDHPSSVVLIYYSSSVVPQDYPSFVVATGHPSSVVSIYYFYFYLFFFFIELLRRTYNPQGLQVKIHCNLGHNYHILCVLCSPTKLSFFCSCTRPSLLSSPTRALFLCSPTRP